MGTIRIQPSQPGPYRFSIGGTNVDTILCDRANVETYSFAAGTMNGALPESDDLEAFFESAVNAANIFGSYFEDRDDVWVWVENLDHE